MKKVLLTLLCSVLLMGCRANVQGNTKSNNNEPSYPISRYLNDKMKEVAKQGSATKASIEGKTPAEWDTASDYVVLAIIISLDETVTVLSDGTQLMLGETFGKLLVQTTYKGEALDGKVLNYAKEGGVLIITT